METFWRFPGFYLNKPSMITRANIVTDFSLHSWHFTSNYNNVNDFPIIPDWGLVLTQTDWEILEDCAVL